jgi:hypothetical protein
MLGEQIAEGTGKRTGRRVISVEPVMKVEVSFEETGTLGGVKGMTIGTYVSQPKPDNSLHGFGRGAFLSFEGDSVMWEAIGIGQFLEGGAVRYTGALSYTTASPKLAHLNKVAGVFEYEVDAAGNSRSKAWEWK